LRNRHETRIGGSNHAQCLVRAGQEEDDFVDGAMCRFSEEHERLHEPVAEVVDQKEKEGN
jgi:hypothetical protein